MSGMKSVSRPSILFFKDVAMFPDPPPPRVEKLVETGVKWGIFGII
jgi:hypothetical protein